MSLVVAGGGRRRARRLRERINGQTVSSGEKLGIYEPQISPDFNSADVAAHLRAARSPPTFCYVREVCRSHLPPRRRRATIDDVDDRHRHRQINPGGLEPSANYQHRRDPPTLE